MNGKAVAALVAAIFLFAALLPLFTNVFAEEKCQRRNLSRLEISK